MNTVHEQIEEAGRGDPDAAADAVSGDKSGPAEPAPRTARILMVAGGTGGHIFPALAVAEELRTRSERGGWNSTRYAIEFVGTRRQLESKLIPAAGFPLRVVEAAGLKGIGGVRRLRNFLVLPYTAVKAAAILREFQPHVVVGVGGYVAGPVMLEAALRDIPTVLIEPNARPGFTNRVLAPVVRAAAVGFEETARFYGGKAHLTGHPVRRAFFEIPPKPHMPPFTVMIVGGSQGSRAINQAVVASLPIFAREAGRIRIVHQTGEPDYNEVRKAYQERGFLAEVHAFHRGHAWGAGAGRLGGFARGRDGRGRIGCRRKGRVADSFSGRYGSAPTGKRPGSGACGSGARPRAVGADAGAAGEGNPRVTRGPGNARSDGSVRPPPGATGCGSTHRRPGRSLGEEIAISVQRSAISLMLWLSAER